MKSKWNEKQRHRYSYNDSGGICGTHQNILYIYFMFGINYITIDEMGSGEKFRIVVDERRQNGTNRELLFFIVGFSDRLAFSGWDSLGFHELLFSFFFFLMSKTRGRVWWAARNWERKVKRNGLERLDEGHLWWWVFFFFWMKTSLFWVSYSYFIITWTGRFFFLVFTPLTVNIWAQG